jgi:DNA-binding MarR family transcriptional regulator
VSKFRKLSPEAGWLVNLDDARPTKSTSAIAGHLFKASRKKGWDWVYQTLHQIAKYLRVSRETVKRAIKWLKENGFIEISRKYLSSRYKLIFIQEQKCSSGEKVTSEDSLRSSSSEPKEKAVGADTAAQAIPSDICREADDVPQYMEDVIDGKIIDIPLSRCMKRFKDEFSIWLSVRRWRQRNRDAGYNNIRNPIARVIKWLNRENWLQKSDIPYRVLKDDILDYYTGFVK